MRDRQDDEFALIIHIDERLTRVGTLRLAVLLEPPPEDQSRRSKSYGSVEWCRPPFPGPEEQLVRDTGGGLGNICVLGAAEYETVMPERIIGRVYAEGESIPAAPPTSNFHEAQFVNMPYAPPLTPPGYCGNVNFAFHPDFGNEMTGAPHAEYNYPLNTVAVWLIRGDENSRHTVQFLGKTATTSECAASLPEAFSAIGRARYRLTNAPFAEAGKSLVLHRSEAPTDERVHVWKTCEKAFPAVQFTLWVTRQGDRAAASLAMESVYGNRLEAPLIWRAADWHENGVTAFALDSPSKYTDVAPLLTVSPEA
jgi:hypothetical protein